jgi:hypothetical protein
MVVKTTARCSLGGMTAGIVMIGVATQAGEKRMDADMAEVTDSMRIGEVEVKMAIRGQEGKHNPHAMILRISSRRKRYLRLCALRISVRNRRPF